MKKSSIIMVRISQAEANRRISPILRNLEQKRSLSDFAPRAEREIRKIRQQAGITGKFFLRKKNGRVEIREKKPNGFFGVTDSGKVERIQTAAQLKTFKPTKELKQKLEKRELKVLNPALSMARATGRPQTIIKDGSIIRVNPTGTFERIGLTKEEQTRRERIKKGTATAKDIIGQQNIKLSSQNINKILTRLENAVVGKVEKAKRFQEILKSVDKSTKADIKKDSRYDTFLEKRAKAITKRGEKLDKKTLALQARLQRSAQGRRELVDKLYSKIPKSQLQKSNALLDTIITAKNKVGKEIGLFLIKELEMVSTNFVEEYPRRIVQALDKSVFLGQAILSPSQKGQYKNYLKELFSKKQTDAVKQGVVAGLTDWRTYTYALLGTGKTSKTNTAALAKKGYQTVGGSSKATLAISPKGKLILLTKKATKSTIEGKKVLKSQIKEISRIKLRNEINRMRKNSRNRNLIQELSEVNRKIDRAITLQQQAKGVQTKILTRGSKQRTRSAAKKLLKGEKSAKQRKLERKDIIKVLDKRNKVVQEIRRTAANERRIAVKKSEALIRGIRREQKLQRLGRRPKAVRTEPVILKGKKSYPFYDSKTKQTRYFTSLKQWRKAVVKQARSKGILTTSEALQAISGKSAPKTQVSKPVTTKAKPKPKKKEQTLFEKLKLKKKDVLVDIERGNQRVIQTKNKIIVLKVKEVPVKTKTGQLLKQKQYQVLQTKQKTKVVQKVKAKTKTKPKTKQTQKQKLAKKSKLQQKQFQITKLKLKPTLLAAVKLKQTQLLKQAQKQKQKQKQKQVQKQKPKQKQKLTQKQKQKQKLVQKVVQKQKQIQKQARKQKQLLKQRQIQKQTQKKRSLLDIPKLKSKPNAKAFNTYVKQGNQWIKANNIKLSRLQAKKIGKFVTENSISRSFIVVGVGGKPTKPLLPVPSVLNAKFRSPKKKSRLPSGTKIEKRKYGINTRGEKKKLSASRVIAQRKKNLEKARKALLKKRKSRK